MDISSEKNHILRGNHLLWSELKFSFFVVSSHFSMIFCKISKFHDISMTGNAFIIFPGFPGTVGTLHPVVRVASLTLTLLNRNWIKQVKNKFHL